MDGCAAAMNVSVPGTVENEMQDDEETDGDGDAPTGAKTETAKEGGVVMVQTMECRRFVSEGIGLLQVVQWVVLPN